MNGTQNTTIIHNGTWRVILPILMMTLACSLPAIFLAGLPAIFLAGCRKEAPPQPYVRSIDLEVWVMGPTDIWLAAGSVFHWDGVSSQAQLNFSRLTLPDPNATVEKLWSATSLGLYGVGNAGTIVRRDASGTWRRIETTPGGGQGGTTLPIMDIYGARDPRTGRYEILCVAEAYGVPGASKIFTIENGNARELTTSGLES